MKSKFISNLTLLVFGVLLTYLPISSFIENKVTLNKMLSNVLHETIIEIFLYTILCFVIFKFISKYKLGVAIIPMLIYCRNHSILVPLVLVSAFYIQILLIGKFIYDSFKVKLKLFDSKYPIWIGIGLPMWALIVILFHLIPFQNDIVALRVLASSLFCILVYINWSFIKDNLIKSFKTLSSFGLNALWALITLFSFFALCAKSNVCLSFDSIWYGMRSQHVLLGESTIYDNLGYTGFVHYYPKLWEVINLLFSGLDYSFLYISTTVCFGIFTSIVLHYANQINKESKFIYTFLVVISVFTIPAIINLATSAKPDIFCSFMFILSTLALVNFKNTNRDQQINLLLFSLMCFSMACLTKFSAWGYAPFYGIYFIYNIVKVKPKFTFNFSSIPYLVFPLLITLILLRNVLITGMPAPLFISIWESIGFEWKYPFIGRVDPLVHHSMDLNMLNHIKKLYAFILRPGDLSTVFWIGNSLLFLMLFVFSKKQMLRSVLFWIFFGSFILIFIRPGIREYQDGNYFIIPIVLILVASVVKLRQMNALSIAFLVFITSFQFMTNFCLNSSWRVGVKKMGFSLFNDINTDKSQLPLSPELIKVNKALTDFKKENGKAPRVVDASGMDRRLTRRLNARVETVKTLCSPYLGSRSVCISNEKFIEYLKWIDADYLLINKYRNDKLGIANGNNSLINLLRYSKIDKSYSFKQTYLIAVKSIINKPNIIKDLTVHYNEVKNKFILDNPKLINNLRQKVSAKKFTAEPINQSKIKFNFYQGSKEKVIFIVRKNHFQGALSYFIKENLNYFVLAEFNKNIKFNINKTYTLNKSPVYISQDNRFTMMVKNNTNAIIIKNDLKIGKGKQRKQNDSIFNIINKSQLIN